MNDVPANLQISGKRITDGRWKIAVAVGGGSCQRQLAIAGLHDCMIAESQNCRIAEQFFTGDRGRFTDSRTIFRPAIIKVNKVTINDLTKG